MGSWCQAVVLGAIALLAAGCPANLPLDLSHLPLSRPADETQIAAILNDVQAGMETKRIYKVLAHVSRSYADEQGRNYEGIKDYLGDLFREYRTIRITRANPRIAVDGTSARAVDTFGTVAEPTEQSSYPPINLQGQVTVYLQKFRDQWMIVKWSPLR